MATYIYQTIPKEGETPREFEYVQSMKDAPLTHDPKTGEPVKRIIVGGFGFAANGLAPIDPYSQKAFRDKTGAKGDTLGALWDRSKELSERRAAKDGLDPVKEKFYADYSKRKKGRVHMGQKKERHDRAIKDLNSKLKKFDVSIGLT